MLRVTLGSIIISCCLINASMRWCILISVTYCDGGVDDEDVSSVVLLTPIRPRFRPRHPASSVAVPPLSTRSPIRSKRELVVVVGSTVEVEVPPPLLFTLDYTAHYTSIVLGAVATAICLLFCSALFSESSRVRLLDFETLWINKLF